MRFLLTCSFEEYLELVDLAYLNNEIKAILEKGEYKRTMLDSNQVKPGKYKLFNEAYPGIPLCFSWMNPITEDFFRRIAGL